MPFEWFEEVTRWCPGVPIFLVACKMDLRHDPQTINTLSADGMEPVTQEQVRVAFAYLFSYLTALTFICLMPGNVLGPKNWSHLLRGDECEKWGWCGGSF